ncbi:ferredoxin [Microbacterium sp. P01]|uniref:ferredoxin n=1 Tax=unclassified Microbacterium TaxID=2609290 RepID=UPI00366DD9B5
MGVIVTQDACIGAGQCALVAPDVFDQDDDGIVVVLNAEPEGDDRVAATRAVRLCPARAIALEG